jgi:dTDP-4-dehydrorhamnose 3,5-epimerase
MRRYRRMNVSQTKIAGVYTIDVERRRDNRGYFARMFCSDEFSRHGLRPVIAQANLSFNARRGTLRGMHFQYPPATETKYVRCARGAILDVAVDLRPESPTYFNHVAFHLSAENGRGLYIPERFAHGFLTLEDDTEVVYLMGDVYKPAAEGGLRYDDPRIGLRWPIPIEVISIRDMAWHPLAEIESNLKARMKVGS